MTQIGQFYPKTDMKRGALGGIYRAWGGPYGPYRAWGGPYVSYRAWGVHQKLLSLEGNLQERERPQGWGRPYGFYTSQGGPMAPLWSQGHLYRLQGFYRGSQEGPYGSHIVLERGLYRLWGRVPMDSIGALWIL